MRPACMCGLLFLRADLSGAIASQDTDAAHEPASPDTVFVSGNGISRPRELQLRRTSPLVDQRKSQTDILVWASECDRVQSRLSCIINHACAKRSCTWVSLKSYLAVGSARKSTGISLIDTNKGLHPRVTPIK